MQMSLIGSKSPLASMAIWGGLLALVPALDQFLVTISLSPEAGLLSDSVKFVTGTIGGALAIVGRWKAKQTISL